MRRVEFYYDLVGPYSYLAHFRLRRICEERGAELALRPMLLGGVHKAVGLQAPVEIEAKAHHNYRDVHRWAEYCGVPLRYPDPFPFRTLKTMRAAVLFEGSGDLDAFTREAFSLYWAEGGAPKGREGSHEDGPIGEVARRAGGEASAQGRDRGSGQAGRVRGADLLCRRRDVLGRRPAALCGGRVRGVLGASDRGSCSLDSSTTRMPRIVVAWGRGKSCTGPGTRGPAFRGTSQVRYTSLMSKFAQRPEKGGVANRCSLGREATYLAR